MKNENRGPWKPITSQVSFRGTLGFVAKEGGNLIHGNISNSVFTSLTLTHPDTKAHAFHRSPGHQTKLLNPRLSSLLKEKAFIVYIF